VSIRSNGRRKLAIAVRRQVSGMAHRKDRTLEGIDEEVDRCFKVWAKKHRVDYRDYSSKDGLFAR
jgi:hypothetical protein